MTREDVLREYRTTYNAGGSGEYWAVNAEAMAERIVELEERIKHLACPVCHEVNPAEVHTCTPAPKVTVVNGFYVVDKDGAIADLTQYSKESWAWDAAKDFDDEWPHEAPHTVRRVALLEDDQ